ncbi:MAG: hypothetical protein AB1716_10040, partial [Planctomycetota bacterium]
DAGPLAILQLVREDEKPRLRSKERTERKRRARVQYTVYAGKPRPHGRRRGAARAKAQAEAPAQAPESAESAEQAE